MIGLLAGAGVGVGAVLIVSAFGTRIGLGALWNRDGAQSLDAGWDYLVVENRSRLELLLGPFVDHELASDVLAGTGLDEDLAVVGSDRAGFLGVVGAKAAAVLVVVAVMGALAPASSPITGAKLVVLAVAASALTVVYEVRTLKSKASERRSEMLEAVSGFMEFTNIAAQTTSVEGAMRSAVAMGASWPFRVIDRVFAQADARGAAPWRGLAVLGRTYGMVELIELGGALEAAGTEGSRVGEMLRAKAKSLRRRSTENEIAVAEARTEQMTIPLVLIGVVFAVLLIAPALMAL